MTIGMIVLALIVAMVIVPMEGWWLMLLLAAVMSMFTDDTPDTSTLDDKRAAWVKDCVQNKAFESTVVDACTASGFKLYPKE